MLTERNYHSQKLQKALDRENSLFFSEKKDNYILNVHMILKLITFIDTLLPSLHSGPLDFK